MQRLQVWLLLTGILATSALPAADWNLDALLHTLAGVPAVNARFEERKELAVLTEPLYLSGILRYRAPHYLLKQTLEPYPESYVVDWDWLIIKTPETERHIYLPGHAGIGALVEAIRATLAGDKSSLQRHYRLRLVEGDNKDWTLRLEPLDATLASYVTAIELRGQGQQVSSVETLETCGDRSLMTIEPLAE